MRLSLAAVAALLVASACAQAEVITEERVRETVTWLAADERAGRRTGSPELVAAGEWIAARFAAAGLRQVVEGSWYHEFPLPGSRLDSRAIELKLTKKEGEGTREVVLGADRDVRLWTASDALAGRGDDCTVAHGDDPVLQRLLFAGTARRPVVCEVKEDHPYWVQAAGEHRVLGAVRQASRPVFLVREGLLAPPGAPRDGGWSADWVVAAAAAAEVPQRNVLAAVRGTGEQEQWVVVSAHYDHLGVDQPVDGDRIYNGADDNASGTTAVILLAEALAKMPAQHRGVMFVCFTGEERGLLGSKAFCERPPVPLPGIVANLNIEMIGRPEPGATNAAWITGTELSDFASIAGPALQRGGVTLVEHDMASKLFSMSDNFSFAGRGIVAHSISAGSLHRDYHRPSDEAGKLEIAHMTTIVRGLLQLTLDLANRDAVPQWNEAGRQRLAKRRPK